VPLAVHLAEPGMTEQGRHAAREAAMEGDSRAVSCFARMQERGVPRRPALAARPTERLLSQIPHASAYVRAVLLQSGVQGARC